MKFDLNSKQGSATLTTLLVIAIVLVVNYLVGGLGVGNFRMDLTQDKLYTLSQGTRNIINGLKGDKPVTLRLYATTEDRVMPPALQNYARSIEDLLVEFQKVSDGRIVIEKLAPNPDTEDEDKAREDEIRGMQVNSEGENLYLGIAVQCLQQKEVLPFLNPQEETALEYQLARAISKVSKTSKPVIGVMSPLPIMGNDDPMAQMRGQQGPPAWFAIEQLKMDYEVRKVEVTADKIDNDISVLVVLHPAGVEEATQFAIDQFVLRGGNLIAFVDPKSWLAEAVSSQQMQNPMMRNNPNAMINSQSNLKKLFEAWGIGFDDDKVVADMSYRRQIQNRVNPTAIMLPNKALNHQDRLTKDLQSIFMIGAGSFSITKTPGIEVTTLLSSSENAQMISNAEADKARTAALTSFSPEGRNLALAVRLQGKFKTAFPNGAPLKKAPRVPGEGGGAQTDANAPAQPSAPAPAPAPAAAPAAPPATAPAPVKAAPPASIAAPPPGIAAPVKAPAQAPAPKPALPAMASMPPPPAPSAASGDFLKESKTDKGVVILVGDADMLYDDLYVQRTQMGMIETASNLSFFLGAVELLSGGGDLISVRNRATTTRPFTTMDKMKSDVESEFRPKMADLNKKLLEAQEKLTNLRGSIDKKSGRVILPPQAQADIARWQESQTDINRQIREVKKQQRKTIDWVETKLTLLNMLAMPLLVIIAGLMLALRRRAATAAK